jgi:hypothetical protein
LKDYRKHIPLDVSIFTVMFVIEGLGLGAGFLQVRSLSVYINVIGVTIILDLGYVIFTCLTMRNEMKANALVNLPRRL